jgi:hypothetical protein
MEPWEIRTQRGKQRLPSAAEPRKMTPSDHKAQIDDTVLNRFDTCLAARKKEQLNAGTKGIHLRGSNAPVQLGR